MKILHAALLVATASAPVIASAQNAADLIPCYNDGNSIVKWIQQSEECGGNLVRGGSTASSAATNIVTEGATAVADGTVAVAEGTVAVAEGAVSAVEGVAGYAGGVIATAGPLAAIAVVAAVGISQTDGDSNTATTTTTSTN